MPQKRTGNQLQMVRRNPPILTDGHLPNEVEATVRELTQAVLNSGSFENLKINISPALVEITAKVSDGRVIKSTHTPVSQETVSTAINASRDQLKAEALRLYHKVGLSQTEIGQRLGKSQGWVSIVVNED